MKIFPKAYLSNQECSTQEALCHILPKLNLRQIFPAVYFVKTNLLGENVQVLLSEIEPSKLPNNNPNISNKSNVDFSMERPEAAAF